MLASFSIDRVLQNKTDRVRLVSVACASMPDPAVINTVDFTNIYVDDVHKYLYCKVEKVASTTWKRVLILLTGKLNATRSSEIGFSAAHMPYGFLNQLAAYPRQQVQRRLRNYFKFVFIREPLERFVSAFRFIILRYPKRLSRFTNATVVR